MDKPWGKENRKKLATAKLRVPNIARVKLSWERLEELFRPSAFTDGDFKGMMDLENGRQLVVRGATKQECKEMLRKFQQLTSLNPVGTPEFTERDGQATSRWKPRKKQLMYLSHFYVRNFPRATKYEELGLTTEAKQSISRRFNFGDKSKPVNFDLLLNEALSTSISLSDP
ncbi:MAG: hypothetical protein F6K40_23985 [Okeania sp. SIO3I5]|uniref:hypothetical protein n=1 Tax=Okeania sp. SIO3I5 TaxID=2607805 RepID=UPI0013BE352A|nr:hypothetical protein [Okeania sp. SIO3I5]NEQ39146.1 hypothetical protein [Okeania sp. SIO3I5]